ncbi:MAG: tetratricopeptide repeat protein [Nitrospirae bacterium]|nr:tetratricopeptide repeat protein [Nitrospirota bacterium]
MAQSYNSAETALEIDRLATQLAKDPQSKAFLPLAEAYGKAGMWQEAAGVLKDGLKYYPGFITAMVALGRAYDQMEQPAKAQAILEESIKLSPENLRAHRTLIKIYQSQGQNDLALQSCSAILTANPRDEEALLVQASLGGPVKQEPAQPKPSALRETQAFATQTNVSPDFTDVPALSPHAGVVVQLEAWLRTIESRRRDRDAANSSHFKTSQ